MEKRRVERRERPASEFDPSLNPQFANIPAVPEQPSASQRIGHVSWEVGKTLAIILLAAFIIRTFLIQPFFVDGHSMEPDFHNNDYLLVNQLAYNFGKPQRGDIIVFKAPPEPTENYIKRIIGVPGDTVELKNGHYTVSNAKHPNGITIDEPYIARGLPTLPESDETKWVLNANDYFVSGDNREPGASSDSRAWGTVPRDNIIGKVMVRVYPLDAIGGVKQHKFPELSILDGASFTPA